MTPPNPNRRQLLQGSLAATTLGLAGCTPKDPLMSTSRMPAIYLSHGGGPTSYVDLGEPPHEVEALVRHWRHIGTLRPKAVLVISAHWEATVPTVQTAPTPPLLFDYYNFPPAAYELTWPAPGSPALAQRVQDLLTQAGIPSATDATRGFDHGVFIPLGRAFPDADVPTLQLSLQRGLDPAQHLAIGRALAPLRDEGVLLLGSGMSFHNLRAFRDPASPAVAEVFDTWLTQTVRAPQAERDTQLTAWESAPNARKAHPREEHLLPLMVLAGAAGADQGTVPFRSTFLGIPISAVQFG